jgi:hypothetical protein
MFWRGSSTVRPAGLLTGLLACLVGGNLLAAVPSLEILRTLGGDDDEILLHRPDALAWGPDGSAYVLNAGEGNVLRFDPRWRLLGTFGALGEGPGEFANPTGLLVLRDQVLVYEMSRITVYDLDGQYLETRRTQNQLYEPVLVDGHILARMGAGETVAAEIDPQGEVIERLGFDCPRNDFIAHFQHCGNVQILPHPEYRCLALNSFSGRATLVGGPGQDDRTVDLAPASGRVTDETREEDSLSVTLTLCMGRAGLDDRGRYWVAYFPPEEEALQLRVYDSALRFLGAVPLPDDVAPFRIYQAPTGELILLDGQSSALHVCRIVEAGD